MYERELYRSGIFTETVTDTIQAMLQSISENVYNVVGFLDVRESICIFYDSSNVYGTEGNQS